MEQAPYQTPFDVDPGGGRRVVPKAVTAVESAHWSCVSTGSLAGTAAAERNGN